MLSSDFIYFILHWYAPTLCTLYKTTTLSTPSDDPGPMQITMFSFTNLSVCHLERIPHVCSGRSRHWLGPACNLITTGQERILFSSHKTLFSNDPDLTWSGPVLSVPEVDYVFILHPHPPPASRRPDYW